MKDNKVKTVIPAICKRGAIEEEELIGFPPTARGNDNLVTFALYCG